MMKALKIIVVGACLSLSAHAAPPPKVAPAADGIFAAFQSHPVVGIAEWHGLAQELDFYSILVRDPRFAREVGNIVLETGDAAQQPVVDRYINGENVPYAELRKVWADTVGWFPTVGYVGSINLYAAIRAVNAGLSRESRIKVWLGEPPIDWARITTKGDWQPLADQRDSYPVGLIEGEILAKDKKALVIYGAGHLGIYPDYGNIRARLDKDHPGALFVVSPYVGYGQKDCAARFEKHIKNWPVPSLVKPIRGSALEGDIFCKGSPPAGITQAAFEAAGRNNSGLTSDALLYLGPRKSMTFSPTDPDIYLDLEYRAELDRRMRLRTGPGMSPPDIGRNSVSPRPFWEQ
jgi:hypothetical protein